MALSKDALLAQARTRYELGRLRRTTGDTWAVVPILAVGAVHRSNWGLILLVGVVLFALTTLFSWRGQGWGRAIWPGFLAGAVPLIVPSLAPANSVCWIGGSCWSLCTLLCPVSGLLSGLAVGILANQQEGRRVDFILAATLIAGVTGAVGCALAGALGIAGMLAGGLLGLLPVYLGIRIQRT